MAELATVARPYAEAIFAAAQGQSAPLEQVAAELDALAQVAQDAQIRTLAGDPQLAAQRLGSLMLSVLPAQPGSAVANLLQVVLENHRLAALPAIAAQFHELKDAAQQRAEAVIETAFALEPAQLDELLPALERKFGCKLYPRVEIDPSLIGGVRVTVGDEVLDTSVRARLDSMRVALTA
jgi:F-type H+-transporting ATPase subunit delta